MTELKCFRLSKGNGLDGTNRNSSRSVVHFGSTIGGHILHTFRIFLDRYICWDQGCTLNKLLFPCARHDGQCGPAVAQSLCNCGIQIQHGAAVAEQEGSPRDSFLQTPGVLQMDRGEKAQNYREYLTEIMAGIIWRYFFHDSQKQVVSKTAEVIMCGFLNGWLLARMFWLTCSTLAKRMGITVILLVLSSTKVLI